MTLRNTFRVQVRELRTQTLMLLAAPDRRRRRLRLQEWKGQFLNPAEAAIDQSNLSRSGFSLARLSASVSARLLSDWSALKSELGTIGAPGQDGRQTGKAFFEEALSIQDLRKYPAFLATAIDEQVLVTVMRAMGMLAHLESVDILVSSPTGDTLSASQLWHHDTNDKRILKLFVYLENTWSSNGPFTYIDADLSQRISGDLGHYVPDERIEERVSRAQWRTVEGEAGTAFFIDTGRCYHFGSRCEQPRYAYIATYSSGLKFMKRSRIWGEMLGGQARRLSPIQLAACGLR